MPTKPRKSEDNDETSHARVTRRFLLEELSCTKVFDKFHEEAQNGSIIGVAGADFAIIAADARHTNESNQALHRISPKLALGTTGDQCCTAQLASLLRARIFMNEHLRGRAMPAPCVAQLLSCLLTNQRCHPSHVATLLAGLDHRGRGAIYAYDPLGYHDAVKYRAMGAAYAVAQPILTKRLAKQSVELSTGGTAEVTPKITFDEAFDLIVCAFKAAVRRADVYTGNVLILDAVTKQGCYTHEVILKDPRKSIECWM